MMQSGEGCYIPLIELTQRLTHSILHEGFIGLRKFVVRAKGRRKLIGNHFVIPHDTYYQPWSTTHVDY